MTIEVQKSTGRNIKAVLTFDESDLSEIRKREIPEVVHRDLRLVDWIMEHAPKNGRQPYEVHRLSHDWVNQVRWRLVHEESADERMKIIKAFYVATLRYSNVEAYWPLSLFARSEFFENLQFVDQFIDSIRNEEQDGDGTFDGWYNRLRPYLA